MKSFRKTTGAVLLAAVFMLMPRAIVYGAESSVIEQLTVTFKTSYGEPEEISEPDITLTANGCSLGDIQFRTDYDKWKPGRKVRVEITVTADRGKYFPTSLNRSKCKITGAEFVSAKALDNNTLQIKVDYKPVTVLGTTEKAGWNSTTKALWKSVKDAPGYTLTLYGDDKVIKRMTVESNYVELSDYMKDQDKTYYYEVKAVPLTTEQKKYLKEGEFVTSADQQFDWQDDEPGSCGSSHAGDGGSLKGDSYVMPDGSKALDSWKMVDGKWYYFDGAGNRTSGWLSNGGRWYYLDQNGVMGTGWVDVNHGSWFYLGSYGDMQTGWILPVPGVWYYLNAYGYMERGWVFVDGKWYYLEQDGRMKTGWLNDNGKWYYLGSDGGMVVNTSVEGWVIGPDGVAAG
ncbi:MAG: N-acetylmuramoyl-L-alanine amidase family protein [Lachnospiraceae bacterium]